MNDRSHPPTDRLQRSLKAGEYEEAAACLRGIGPDADRRRAALRAVRTAADDDPAAMEPLLPATVTFLTDGERSIRLTAAKLFVAAAETEPSTVTGCTDALAARLADEAEFYYVRARAAEALGYVALEHPEDVATPELLADLRIGLSFDEPEVKEKLAKALAHVALGDPSRLRHRVDSLAEQLDDGNDLVRYHLCTTLTAVACEHPFALSDAPSALAERLADENPYVRARAAETLGLVARADATGIDRSAAEIPPRGRRRTVRDRTAAVRP